MEKFRFPPKKFYNIDHRLKLCKKTEKLKEVFPQSKLLFSGFENNFVSKKRGREVAASDDGGRAIWQIWRPGTNNIKHYLPQLIAIPSEHSLTL